MMLARQPRNSHRGSSWRRSSESRHGLGAGKFPEPSAKVAADQRDANTDSCEVQSENGRGEGYAGESVFAGNENAPEENHELFGEISERAIRAHLQE